MKSARDRKKPVNREKGIFDRKGEGKVGGRKRASEKYSEIVPFVKTMRKEGISYRKISERVDSEMGVKVSYVGVKNLLDEIDTLKRYERNLKRRKEYIT